MADGRTDGWMAMASAPPSWPRKEGRSISRTYRLLPSARGFNAPVTSWLAPLKTPPFLPSFSPFFFLPLLYPSLLRVVPECYVLLPRRRHQEDIESPLLLFCRPDLARRFFCPSLCVTEASEEWGSEVVGLEMDPTGAFSRSSSNMSLASLVRSGSGGSGRGRGGSRRMMQRVLRGVITFIFAIAGLFLGAVTGGLIGLATESGLFRGTGIGAITGALVSIEVVDSSIRLWRSRRSGIWSILYVLNVIYSLLTGRLVREKVDPAVQRVVRSQMNAVDSSQFREAPDLFEIEGTNGMPRASIDKLPEVRITEEYNRNAVGDLSGCSVCLQDFQIGEKVRSLPDCWHVFHVPCIDGWLIKHGSCPLCRRKL